MSEPKTRFNPLQSPPDMELAALHAKANLIGKIVGSEQANCPCCGLNYNKEQLPLCSSTRDFQSIGSGYVLWFSSTVYVCIILFLCFWVNYLKLMDNYDANACLHYEGLHPCENDWTHKLSLANYGLDYDERYTWTMVIFIGMMYLLLAIFKSKLNNEHKVVDIETDTAADFSIMATYLPKSATEMEVTRFFESHIPGVKVARVSMAYNIEKLNHLLKEKKHAEHNLINVHSEYFKKQERLHQQVSLDTTPHYLRLESNDLNRELDEMELNQEQFKDAKYLEAFQKYKAVKDEVKEERLHILKNHEQYFTGIAFISFERMAMADLYTSRYYRSAMKWFFVGCKYKLRYPTKGNDYVRVRIDPAPEAEEVLWKNLRFDFKEQSKKKAKTALVVFFIMAITFGIIYGLKYAKFKIKKSYLGPIIEVEHEDGTKSEKYGDLSESELGHLTLISIAIFAVCKITNKIFDHIIIDLTVMEKHYSLSQHYSSAVIKTVISQFINTSLLVVIVHYVLKGEDRHVIWGVGSLIVDIWYLVFFNALIMPLLHVLNFGVIKKLVQRCRLKKHKDSKRYTQLQAHKICEGVPMDAVRCYTDIYQVLLTGLFFTPVFPITCLLFFFTLVAVYWIEKFYTLRVYTVPVLLQDQITRDVIVFVKVGAFSLSLGMLYFDWILRKAPHDVLIVLLVVTFVLIFVPIENMFQGMYTYTGEEAEIKKHLTYFVAQPTFLEDYEGANPVTGNDGFKVRVRNITKTREVNLVGPNHVNITTSQRETPTNLRGHSASPGQAFTSDNPEADALVRRVDPQSPHPAGYLQIAHEQVRMDVGEIPEDI